MRTTSACVLALLALSLACSLGAASAATRQIISLDGAWQIGQGGMDAPPAQFDHAIPVPGLVDMARPAFKQAGVKSDLRQAFWYRKTLHFAGAVPAVATLKLLKVKYGARVYLNGALIGDHLPSFTPGIFDVHDHLLGNGADNVLVVRVGAWINALPPTIPAGWDGEKSKYIPGIYDSVRVILSGTPNIVNVQAAPDIANHTLRVQALLHDAGPDARTPVSFVVREWKTGVIAGAARISAIALATGKDKTVDVRIPIRHCHLWSPESPFLYTLDVTTSADTEHTRFGMREFHFANGRAYLNGRVYYMRGSNIDMHRFFEDKDRGDLPWNASWVRRLYRSFKGLHWNCLRYCIGYSPEFWYDIADEEGFLIQDEFPVWGLPPAVKADELAGEYAEHMRADWNHPSVALWDAQNESVSNLETGRAEQMVRGLDQSHRPWDNGWGGVQEPGDSYEAHPYHFGDPSYRLPRLAHADSTPAAPFIGTKAKINHWKPTAIRSGIQQPLPWLLKRVSRI